LGGLYLRRSGTAFAKHPAELRGVADQHGLDGEALVRHSRLTARVDNNAIGDGFQIYLHTFVVTRDGEWAVVQQGMNEGSRMARRYHWHSPSVRSFTEAPHTAIVGEPQGTILNLVDPAAGGGVRRRWSARPPMTLAKPAN
jgi:hypothetical protein